MPSVAVNLDGIRQDLRVICRGNPMWLPKAGTRACPYVFSRMRRRIDGCEIARYNQSMISEQDKAMIVDLARRYDVKGVLLFGSSIDPDREANDIDLAIEGIAPAKFFDFYGELLFALSKPVDLVELSRDSKFNRLVYQEGVRLYGQSA